MSQTITEQAASMVDSITSPTTAVPVIGVAGYANWLTSLPTIINVLTACYLFLLVSHKAYTMYREWRTTKEEKGKE